MHVILSVPMPSEAAKFVGHILSNINSTVLDNPNPYISVVLPFNPGDVFPFMVFLVGEVILFLPVEVVEADALDLVGELSPFIVNCLLLSLALVS